MWLSRPASEWQRLSASAFGSPQKSDTEHVETHPATVYMSPGCLYHADLLLCSTISLTYVVVKLSISLVLDRSYVLKCTRSEELLRLNPITSAANELQIFKWIYKKWIRNLFPHYPPFLCACLFCLVARCLGTLDLSSLKHQVLEQPWHIRTLNLIQHLSPPQSAFTLSVFSSASRKIPFHLRCLSLSHPVLQTFPCPPFSPLSCLSVSHSSLIPRYSSGSFHCSYFNGLSKLFLYSNQMFLHPCLDYDAWE